MTSHAQKQLYLKFELLQYNKLTDRFEVVGESLVEERKMPDGVSNISGGLSINLEQDVRTTLDLQITNHDGMNNWGADFDIDDDRTFKWWLDKRLNVYVGLRLDEARTVEYIQMAHLVVTHFKTNHSITSYPVIEIQAGSKEVLYATRRGKFLYNTKIHANSVMTEVITRLLKEGGEIDSNIKIDPSIAHKSYDLDKGDSIDHWNIIMPNTTMEVDYFDFAFPESSLRFDVKQENATGVIAEKTFEFPFDMSTMEGLALWARCTRDVEENDMSIVIEDESGFKNEYPLRQMVGHVIGENDEPVYVDNWRNVVLATDNFNQLTKVKKISLVVNKDGGFKAPYSFWINKLYCAEFRNLLPYELTYGAGDNRWTAIKEIADLLDSYAYYDDYGNFILEKRKIPKDRYSEDFQYDAYEVLTPVITYDDTKRYNNMYAGSEDNFDEHELANHIQVTGGSTSDTVMSLVDMKLRVSGLECREKGKYINRRGKIRAVDQFHDFIDPTVFNENSDVERIYKHHKNKDAVVNDYPYGFPEITKPPIVNYAIERIGDFIYHHNNANPDPVIVYAYEGKNRALWEIRKRLAHAEVLNVISVPYWILRAGSIIRIQDSLLDINDNFEIQSINIPLNGDYFSITANKIHNLLIDIPYFDLSHPKANACWYGYDMCGLAFTYEYWYKRKKPDEDEDDLPSDNQDLPEDMFEAFVPDEAVSG